MSDDSFLHASDLTAVRDRRTLFAGLSLRVAAGELWRVEGPNGAGKTTLLRILCGLDQDFEGRVAFPCAQAADRPWREDILHLGHLPGLKPALTAEENLDWLCRLRERPLRCALRDALQRVGLAGYEDMPVAALSAGQKRRVALARLHLEAAPLWILDEPFTAVDRDGVATLEELLVTHVRGGGAVIVTTHHALTGIDTRRLQLGAVA